MRLFRDLDLGAIWRQHPDWNLQAPTDRVNDGDRTISRLRPPQDFNSSAVEWVERIEDLDVRLLRAQGIVGEGVVIRMCTAPFRPAVYLQIAATGFIRGIRSFS